jgi:DNA-binding LacI/PurR family transcriptional regulator
MTQQQNSISVPALGRDSANLLALLREEILSGQIAIGDFLPTVRRLSSEREVAHGTAWRALKALESEGLVEARPRRGYRVLGTKVTASAPGTVAYVLDQRNLAISWGPLYHQLLSTAGACAKEKGLDLLKMILAPDQEAPLFRQLQAAGVSGLILDSLNESLLRWSQENNIPAIIVDDWCAGLNFDVVLQGNGPGGQLAAQHLLDLGCRKIAWFGQVENHHGQARYGGACGALAAAGTGFFREKQIPLEPKNGTVVAAARQLLTSKSRPDGIIALHGTTAVAVINQARAMGLKIGKDLQVIGWCCQELYTTSYAAMFDGAPPPAIVWSSEEMIKLALARLATRSANRELPTTCTMLQVSIREGE